MHSTMPYLAYIKPPTTDFAKAPYTWLAFPIIDGQRWFGFDLFAAWLDVYLMSLMFFLSGLFVHSALIGKGSHTFLVARLRRLGAPFVFALIAVMPVALYPAYRVRAVGPTLLGYAESYLSLPFVPNGPMWFLWMLLALTAAIVALRFSASRAVEFLSHFSSRARQSPNGYFVGLATAATIAYVPLAVAFSPWDWRELGPFSFQVSRPMLYSVYYLAGFGVGAHGLGNGLLAADGRLAACWRQWLLAAVATLLLWMGLTGLTLSNSTAAPRALVVIAEASYAWAGVASVFFVLAASLRLRAFRSRFLDSVSHNAFGLYVLHYPPLVWLQYAMLDVPLPAIPKALIVFGGTLAASFAGTALFAGAQRGLQQIGARARISE